MKHHFVKFDILIIILAVITGLAAAYFFSCFVQSACADYKNCTDHSYTSPIPTDTIVSPSLSPILSPSLTVTSVSPANTPTDTPLPTPTPTPQTQIGTPASANNTQSAGSSAAPSTPTSAPDTGHASTVQGLQPYVTPLPGAVGWK